MNKTKIIQDIVSNLKGITISLESLIEAFDKTPATKIVNEQQGAKIDLETPTQNEESISIEGVRAVLAAKSQGGKQSEVKALIVKYGANKLTDLDPSCYKDLLKEAEVF